jgi:hypothetical protein
MDEPHKHEKKKHKMNKRDREDGDTMTVSDSLSLPSGDPTRSDEERL